MGFAAIGAVSLSFATFGITAMAVYGPLLCYFVYKLLKRTPPLTLRLGSDGLLIRADFIPWSDVVMIVHDTNGVRLLREHAPSLTIDALDVEGFELAANEALAAYKAAPPAPSIEVLRVRVETSEERAARLAQLRAGSGYRGANADEVDLDMLEALLRSPAADPAERQDAMRLLARLDPTRLERAQAQLESTLDPSFARSMAEND